MGSDSAEMAAPPPRGTRGSDTEELSRVFGIGPASAQLLVAAGYRTPEQVRALSDADLRLAGVDPSEIGHIRAGVEAQALDPPAPPTPEPPPVVGRAAVSGEKIVERWLDSVKRNERPKRRHVPLPAKDSTDVLKKWVEGDDRAMEAWIQASEVARPIVVPAPVPTPSESETSAVPAGEPGEAPVPAAPAGISQHLQAREETVVRWLTDLLDRVKSDQFDPHSLVQEVQELLRQLFEERAKRKQLEDEVEHVKRGSIAVIKYVRSREARSRDQAVQAKDAEIAELRLRLLQGGLSTPDDADPLTAGASGAPVDAGTMREIETKLRGEYQGRENQFIERETELRRRIVQLEAEVRSLRTESEVVNQRARLLSLDEGSLPESLDERLKAFDARERELLVRENELRTKFEEIRIGSEEIERRRAPLAFKERELAAWELQLKTTKQAVELEARRIEQSRAEEKSAPAVPAEQLKQIEDLRAEINRKEEELRSRESFVHQKMEELEVLQRKAAEWQADQIHADVVASANEVRVRSGVRRLDDLVFGGFPIGSQVLVNGPSHTGKDILARLFIAEGLKAGVPALWVVTDKTYTQIREEMTGLLPAYPQYEARGLVRYVDLYSRSLGVTQGDSSAKLLSATDKGGIDQVATIVNQYSQELKEKAPSYRLVFESVSTLTAYLDTTGMFRFLQPFVGRRKLDGAAAYYVLETGMHTDSDLQTLEHMMDGSLNLKVDQLKTFLQIKGITDAQSRAWVGYTFTKRSFSLGSFSLDHIR
jgi:KaiC/GvpD/RAD55 family RecA-like ATPase